MISYRFIIQCKDARAQEEYDISHIPDSIRVDYNKEEPWNGIDFTNTKKGISILSPNTFTVHLFQVVCYCSVGYRSSVVADKLSRHLKEQNIDVYNLEGGVFQWAIENNELNGQSTNQVHPYSSLWGKLLPVNLRYKPPDSNL